ncbi:MAG: chromosomal replication initiator protein DnaA [Patescibacteria group bacterium]|nr:chromosomal replication initiator protein DnaA [Patescibacteria group bacterium]
MDVEQLWTTCLGELEVLLSRANFTTWFKDTSVVKIDGDTVTIGTPNSFTKEWLEKKYHNQIIETLNRQLKNIQRVEYIIGSSKSHPNDVIIIKKTKETTISSEIGGEEQSEETDLNKRYTFETFVIGESNRLAHAAAQAVTKNPGITYNPLFIYGGVGLGKTHLMQAIGNEIRRRDKKKNVVYTTCEKFTNEFISMVRKGKAEQFKNNYRNADALLIDDIQFLAGKSGTQEEFFHTFNELHGKSKQIVMTSDRPPKAVSALEARLVSRFEWGMLADINPPDLETRIAILQTKVKEKDVNIGEDIVNFIAKNIQNNIRELEGALNRIVAYSELNNAEPSLDDVKRVLGEPSGPDRQKNITTKEILKKIADFYDITVDQILGQRRNKELVYPRQICAYILREELNYSFPKIGKELGGKDHTTIMHACSKIGKEMQINEVLKHELNSIKEKLYSL